MIIDDAEQQRALYKQDVGYRSTHNGRCWWQDDELGLRYHKELGRKLGFSEVSDDDIVRSIELDRKQDAKNSND